MTHEQDMLVVINMAKQYLLSSTRPRFSLEGERALRVAYNNIARAYKEATNG